MEKLDPKLKLKLREAARRAGPDWPDCRGGIFWGAVFALPTLFAGEFLFRLIRFPHPWLSATALAGIVGLCAGLAIAFRPVK